MKTIFSILILALITNISCSSTEPLPGDPDRPVERELIPIFDIPDDVIEENINVEGLDANEILMVATRSRLSDLYSNNQHDLPEIFLHEIVKEEKEIDIYAGFRIQILSTRNVHLADSTRNNFQAWADTTFIDYVPQAYIFFRQPNYRVHIGDFHGRERAADFSRLIKWKYRDAWVVHDRINPYRVPADTVDFTYN